MIDNKKKCGSIVGFGATIQARMLEDPAEREARAKNQESQGEPAESPKDAATNEDRP